MRPVLTDRRFRVHEMTSANSAEAKAALGAVAPTPEALPPMSGIEAEKPFALLIEAVQEYAIFRLDPEGNVATWNAGACRITGYTAEEIIERPFSVFYTPEDLASGKPARELAQAAEHGQCRDEGWRVRKDGRRFWATVAITAVFDGDGSLQGFVKVTRDDTDRRQAEEQVRHIELLTERERIANDLRATIVHRIFEAGLSIQGLLQLTSDPIASTRIQNAVDLLDETLKDIRTVVLGLDTALE
jgi:PAS domain S-box-containing protein